MYSSLASKVLHEGVQALSTLVSKTEKKRELLYKISACLKPGKNVDSAM